MDSDNALGSENVSRATVLVVDDTADNLTVMVNLLKEHFRVKVAITGDKALRIMDGPELPDLVLLDVMMPGMDGFEVCGRLKANARTREVPVIFLTARSEDVDERRGFELGAEDYITKPINPAIVLARVTTHLHLKQARDFLQDRNVFLEAEVRRRTREVTAIQEATISAMAALAEARDNETGMHVRRTQLYVQMLARMLQSNPRFSTVLSDQMIRLLHKTAPLHDIGKIGIPDSVLLKPGKLDAVEWEIMKTHTVIGSNTMIQAERQLNAPSVFFRVAREISLSHHERWDGSGYPEGLAGDAIPISARLMALADVYDALISKRVYKAAFSHESAVELIAAERAKQFDPDVVDAFLTLEAEFLRVAHEYADSHPA